MRDALQIKVALNAKETKASEIDKFTKEEKTIVLESALMHLTDPDSILEMADYLDVTDECLREVIRKLNKSLSTE